jgi:hypothetical protein
MFMLSRTARVCKNGDADESYGIVTFPSREKAQEAIQKMNGHQLLSQTIECSFESTFDLDVSDTKSESTSSRRSSTDSDDGKAKKKKKKKNEF